MTKKELEKKHCTPCHLMRSHRSLRHHMRHTLPCKTRHAKPTPRDCSCMPAQTSELICCHITQGIVATHHTISLVRVGSGQERTHKDPTPPIDLSTHSPRYCSYGQYNWKASSLASSFASPTLRDADPCWVSFPGSRLCSERHRSA